MDHLNFVGESHQNNPTSLFVIIVTERNSNGAANDHSWQYTGCDRGKVHRNPLFLFCNERYDPKTCQTAEH